MEVGTILLTLHCHYATDVIQDVVTGKLPYISLNTRPYNLEQRNKASNGVMEIPLLTESTP